MVETLTSFFEGLGIAKAEVQINFIFSDQILFAIWETFYATVFATLFAYAIGFPLGIILVIGEKDSIFTLPKSLMRIINVICNLLRSIPFLILMVMLFPLSRLIVRTSIGTTSCIVALTVAAAPFIARLVEASLREVDKGVIEAAQAFGASPWQIVREVMIPEAKSSLLNGLSTACITILSYSAMSGNIGGGGLGALALLRGHGRQEVILLYVSCLFLVILVQVIQSILTRIAVGTDRRITK